MTASRLRTTTSCLKNERGFTLPELLVTILIVGIISTIGTVSWLSVTESRRVDSAANQLAADLRQTHSKATNRLVDHVVSQNPSSLGVVVPAVPVGQPPPDYYIIEIRNPITSSVVSPRELPGTTQLSPSTPLGVRFVPDGSAVVLGGASATVTVSSGADPNNDHDVTITPSTSRVQIVP